MRYALDYAAQQTTPDLAIGIRMRPLVTATEVVAAAPLVGPTGADDFADAIDLPFVGELTLPDVDDTDFTAETGEPNHAGAGSPERSAWWKITPDADCLFYAYTAGSTYVGGASNPDTVLALYTGASVDALTEVVSNDDTIGPPNDFTSRIFAKLTAGTTYYLAAGPYPGEDPMMIRLSYRIYLI